MYCTHFLRLKKTCSKTKENIINRKSNVFDVKYIIYFTRETFFFHIFILASQLWTYKNSSNSWNEFHIQRQIMGYSIYIFFSEPIYTKSWIKHLLEKVGINGHALFQWEIKTIKDFLIKSFWFLSLLTIYILLNI